MAIVETHRIQKHFGDLLAVSELTFEISAGTTVGLLGPNGAGKTTLLHMLTTLLKPTSGTARVNGYDVLDDPQKVRNSIGLIPQTHTTDPDLTAAENLAFYAGLYGLPFHGRRRRIDELLEAVGLLEWRDKLVRTFSGGMRRRLEIARVLLHEPRILFFDEPTTGLDPASRTSVWGMMKQAQARSGLTIVLTTHYMEEVDPLCDRIALIDRGTLVALDTPSRLKASLPDRRCMEATFGSPPAGWSAILAALPYVKRVHGGPYAYQIESDDTTRTTAALLAETRSRKVELVGLGLKANTIEDVFLHFTGHDLDQTDDRDAPDAC